MKVRIFLLLVLVASLFSSCKCWKEVGRDKQVTRTDSTYYSSRKMSITVPGKEASLKTNISSGIHFIYKDGREVPCLEVPSQRHGVSSKDKLLKAEVIIDSLGNMVLDAQSLTHQMEVELQDKTRIITEKEQEIIRLKEQETLFGAVIKKIALIIAGIVGLIIVLVIALNAIRPRLI